MLHHGCQDLPVRFLNVQAEDDREQLRQFIIGRIQEVRREQERQIDLLVGATDRLVTNQKTEETRAVFQSATRAFRNWSAVHVELPKPAAEAKSALLKEMAGLRYASSLRASVNRRGNWHNFDYWHALGFGTRSETVVRTMAAVEELRILFKAALRDDEFEVVHDFLSISLAEFETSVASFYEWAQALGESAFKAQLSADLQYWADCQNRWGGGPGYKDEIKTWTQNWFSDEARRAREVFIEAEVSRRWKEILAKFTHTISSGSELQNGLSEDGVNVGFEQEKSV